MMQQRRDVLDDALCMVDEDLLARVIVHRPRNEGRGARKLMPLFGRQIPVLVASLAAVGILLVGVAAIPGIVRMARLLLGVEPTPTPPTPPVGGTVSEVESDESHVAPNTEPALPDSSGTLMVNGERVDCGEHRPLFREYPTGDGIRPTVFVPLTVTLRAIGAEIGEVVNGQVPIRLNGRNYTLFIFSRTLREDTSPQNLLAAATGASGWVMQSGSDELMVDTDVLFENVLYAMCGERMLWQVTADYGTGCVWVTKSESQAAMHALRTLPMEGLQKIEETNFPDSPTNDRFITDAAQMAEIVRCLRELPYAETSVDAGGMDGSTMELTFFYEDGKIIHIYLFGNQFVRIDDGGEALPWLSIGLSDAAALLRVIFGT